MRLIKRALEFLMVLVIVFIVVGKLIVLLWPDVTDYLASWFNTVGVEETTDLLVDFNFLVAAVISLAFCVLIWRRRSR